MSPKKIAQPLDVYVRVSDVRGRSGDSFISPKDQEERCRGLAVARLFRLQIDARSALARARMRDLRLCDEDEAGDKFGNLRVSGTSDGAIGSQEGTRPSPRTPARGTTTSCPSVLRR